jgi:hypothetical protein
MNNNLFSFKSFEESVTGTIMYKDCVFGEQTFPFIEMDFHTNRMHLLDEDYTIMSSFSIEFTISDFQCHQIATQVK